MSAKQQPVRRPHLYNTAYWWLTPGPVIIILGVLSVSIIALGGVVYNGVYGSVHVQPSIHYQLRCANSRQCVLTIQNAGGGFDHGFNPAYSWAITGVPATSLGFSATSGTLQAHHSVQVQVIVAPGSCPRTITITSGKDFVYFNPFVSDARTGHCIVAKPVLYA